MKKLLLLLLPVASGLAQVSGNLIPPSRLPWFPAELKQYLALSDAQADTIVQLNVEYSRLAGGKQLRSAQVQREIAEWTAKEPLDPMALGLRYTELEVIRRELRDELARTREKVVAALDTAQKAKLKALEDAMKLQPVIAQAQCENLLVTQVPSGILPVRGGDFTFTPGPVTGETGYATFLLGLPSLNCGPLFVRDPTP